MLEITEFNSVYLPAQRKAKEPRLMVVLHGLGDSVEGYRFLPNFLGIDDCNYLLLNAPDQYFTGFSWFDIYENPEPGILRSRKLLFSLVDELGTKGFSPEQLLFFGFSQGALMVIDLACRYPAKFLGVFGISGYVYGVEKYPEEFSDYAQAQKLCVTHGTHDQVLAIENTRQQISALTKMGLDIRWQEYPKEHTIDPTNEKQDLVNFYQEITNSQ